MIYSELFLFVLNNQVLHLLYESQRKFCCNSNNFQKGSRAYQRMNDLQFRHTKLQHVW